jgi:FkbM family methyltransferase
MGISQEQIKELIGEKEDIVIFEVGCADGTDTKKFLSTFGDNLTIYTFDPEPINIKYMTTLGSKDAWGNNNDVLVQDSRHKFSPYAIANNDGITTFNRSRNITPYNFEEGFLVGRYSGSIHEPLTMLQSEKYGARWPATVFEEKITIECKKLDTFCKENDVSHIDFLWMDTQGAEREVLMGATEMLSNIDYVYTEYYDEEMYKSCADLEEIKKILTGFELIGDWRYSDADGGDALFKRIV